MEQEYLKLMQQLVEQQKENIELRKEMLCGHPKILRVKKAELPLIGMDTTKENGRCFWIRYKDICRLEDQAVIRNELWATSL